MSEYAPVMAMMPAPKPTMMPKPAVMMPKPVVMPTMLPTMPMPQPKAVMSYGKKSGGGNSAMYKLAMTLVVVLGMGTWVWGSMKFHKCGSGWMVAILKQLGVTIAVSFGYGAAMFSIVQLIDIWNKKAAAKTARTVSEPVVSGLTIATLLIAVNLAIFRDKCRL
jgi:hypothetical protein